MKTEELISEIEDMLNQINNEDFVSLWNKLFEEEKIKSVDNSREDLQDLLLDEVSYFETSRITRIHKYLNSKL